MYGWRAKIGVLVPCVNTTTEIEFNFLASRIPGVTIHSARMHLNLDDTLTKKGLLDMHSSAIEKTIPELAHANVDVIVFACTSGSFVGGRAWDLSTIDEISQKTGVQAITTSSALLATLDHFAVESVALGTPYDKTITNLGQSFLEEAGYDVVESRALDCIKSIVNDNRFTLAYDLGREVDKPNADCVFISCTQLPTLKIVRELEGDIGKPVFTANLVSFWYALKVLSIKFTEPEFGILFS